MSEVNPLKSLSSCTVMLNSNAIPPSVSPAWTTYACGAGVGVGNGVVVGVGVNVGIGMGVGGKTTVASRVALGEGSGTSSSPCDRRQPSIADPPKIAAATASKITRCKGCIRRAGAATSDVGASASSGSALPHIRHVLAPSATRAPHAGQYRGGRSGSALSVSSVCVSSSISYTMITPIP